MKRIERKKRGDCNRHEKRETNLLQDFSDGIEAGAAVSSVPETKDCGKCENAPGDFAETPVRKPAFDHGSGDCEAWAHQSAEKCSLRERHPLHGL